MSDISSCWCVPFFLSSLFHFLNAIRIYILFATNIVILFGLQHFGHAFIHTFGIKYQVLTSLFLLSYHLLIIWIRNGKPTSRRNGLFGPIYLLWLCISLLLWCWQVLYVELSTVKQRGRVIRTGSITDELRSTIRWIFIPFKVLICRK